MKDEARGAFERDDDLAQLLGEAPPRERPAAEAQAAAFRQLHDEWRELVARRRRRRQALVGIAASLLVASAALWNLLGPSGGIPIGPSLATIERVEGRHVTWTGQPTAGGPTDAVRSGATVMTGSESRVALAWRDRGSLRLDEHTRVEVLNERSVRLVEGSVYYDSVASSGGSVARSGAALSIETPAGDVLHVGTQFMVSVDQDDVVLRVREGQVKVTGDGFELTVGSGERLDVDRAGTRARGPIDGYDPVWDWVQEIAPLPSLEGRTALDILTWIGRETGRRVVYDTMRAETSSRSTIVRGLDRRSPTSMLAILPVVTDLDVEIRDDVIVVSSP